MTPAPSPNPISQLAKTYNPAETEPRISARWDQAPASSQASPFHADVSRIDASHPPYCILIPPPNVTAALHLGHALNNTLQDVLARAHRMKGFETLWMPGTDHAGIATQAVVEKRLRAEGKLKGPLKQAMQRDEFVAHVQAFKDEYEATITRQLKDMGCSCDWARQRFTMDEQCAAAVREAFFRLFKDGLIYRGKRLVNWDPALQTAVADDECYDEDVDSQFCFLRYPLTEPVRLPSGETIDHITVATTRPETYFGDTAVAMNPKDPRAKALVGRKVRLPLVGREIPILADAYAVLPDSLATTEEEKNDPKAKFSTGFVKITPAHDTNDYALWQRHLDEIPLGAINMMSPDGRVSKDHGWSDVGEAGKFVGLKMAEARKQVVEEFNARGLLAETRPYRHSLKFSDRSKAVIEPYLSDQWYVRVTDERMAPAANRALVAEQQSGKSAKQPIASASDGTLRFYPARYAKTYEQWHDNIRDWCISRQLWWGHRIPVWSKQLAPTQMTPGAHSTLTDSQGALKTHFGFLSSDENDAVWVQIGDPAGDGCRRAHVSVRPGFPAIETKLAEHGYSQDPDVLDTWFSSALWPISTMGWPDPAKYNAESNRGLLEAFNPSSVLCTAREIITLWVSRMVMFNRYFRAGTGHQAPGTRPNKATDAGCPMPDAGSGPVPFRDVFIHAMIQDGQGRKMSKSLGNGVDPRDIIESHGADAMRFTLVQMTTNTQDVRMPVRKDSRTGKNSSEKFDGGRNYCNKLWNTARFVLEKLARSSSSGHAAPLHKQDLSLTDRWMLSRLAATVKSVDASLAAYEFSDYAESLYKLLWWDLCDWYLEAVKPTVDQSPVQQAVLAHALETIVRLLHPITPFITEAIWEQLRHVETAPIAGVDLGPSRRGELLCTAGWPRIDAAWIDPAAEAQFEELRELISAIRNVRSEKQVPPKRRITLHATSAAIARMKLAPGIVETLCGLDRVDAIAAGGNGDRHSGVPFTPVRASGEELFLSNLADAAAGGDDGERDRLAKQLESLRKTESTIAGRLSNPGYADRAPAKLVEESRAQLARTREEIAAIESRLGTL